PASLPTRSGPRSVPSLRKMARWSTTSRTASWPRRTFHLWPDRLGAPARVFHEIGCTSRVYPLRCQLRLHPLVAAHVDHQTDEVARVHRAERPAGAAIVPLDQVERALVAELDACFFADRAQDRHEDALRRVRHVYLMANAPPERLIAQLLRLQ